MTRKSDIRAKAIAGLSDGQIAEQLGISRRTVRAVLAGLRASGNTIPTSGERRRTTDDDGSHDRGDHDVTMSV